MDQNIFFTVIQKIDRFFNCLINKLFTSVSCIYLFRLYLESSCLFQQLSATIYLPSPCLKLIVSKYPSPWRLNGGPLLWVSTSSSSAEKRLKLPKCQNHKYVLLPESNSASVESVGLLDARVLRLCAPNNVLLPKLCPVIAAGPFSTGTCSGDGAVWLRCAFFSFLSLAVDSENSDDLVTAIKRDGSKHS